MILALDWQRAIEFALEQACATGRRQSIRYQAVLPNGHKWWIVQEAGA